MGRNSVESKVNLLTMVLHPPHLTYRIDLLQIRDGVTPLNVHRWFHL